MPKRKIPLFLGPPKMSHNSRKANNFRRTVNIHIYLFYIEKQDTMEEGWRTLQGRLATLGNFDSKDGLEIEGTKHCTAPTSPNNKCDVVVPFFFFSSEAHTHNTYWALSYAIELLDDAGRQKAVKTNR